MSNSIITLIPPPHLSSIEAQIYVARRAASLGPEITELIWAPAGLMDDRKPLPEHWAPSGWRPERPSSPSGSVLVTGTELRYCRRRRRLEARSPMVEVTWDPEEFYEGKQALVAEYRRCFIMYYYSGPLGHVMHLLWTPVMTVRRRALDSEWAGVRHPSFRVIAVPGGCIDDLFPGTGLPLRQPRDLLPAGHSRPSASLPRPGGLGDAARRDGRGRRA